MKLANKFFLNKSEFYRNTLILISGTFLAQIIPILSYPILGRIYDPTDFGLLANILSISSLLTVISTGKFEFGILITQSKEEAIKLMSLTIHISSIILVISSIILYLFSIQISIALNIPELANWILICPLIAFFIIVFNIYNEWCVKHKLFKQLATNKIFNSSSNTLTKVICGVINIKSGLVLGELSARFLTVIFSVIQFYRKDQTAYFKISWNESLKLVKKYIHFPKFYFPDQLINTIGLTFPIIFISSLFSVTDVGIYSMTINVLAVPTTIISTALRDVFRQRALEEYSKHGQFSVLFKKLFKRLFTISLIAAFCIFYFLPDLFTVILGSKWTQSGIYAQLLVPMFIFDFISNSLSGGFIIVNKLKWSLYWQIYYLFSTIISLLIGYILKDDIYVLLICFSIARSSAFVLYILLSYRISKGFLYGK